MNLKQQLQAALSIPDSDFSSHATDLYVVDSTGKVMQWLRKNYAHYKNVTSFTGQLGSSMSGKKCLDIPFAV